MSRLQWLVQRAVSAPPLHGRNALCVTDALCALAAAEPAAHDAEEIFDAAGTLATRVATHNVANADVARLLRLPLPPDAAATIRAVAGEACVMRDDDWAIRAELSRSFRMATTFDVTKMGSLKTLPFANALYAASPEGAKALVAAHGATKVPVFPVMPQLRELALAYAAASRVPAALSPTTVRLFGSNTVEQLKLFTAQRSEIHTVKIAARPKRNGPKGEYAGEEFADPDGWKNSRFADKPVIRGDKAANRAFAQATLPEWLVFHGLDSTYIVVSDGKKVICDACQVHLTTRRDVLRRHVNTTSHAEAVERAAEKSAKVQKGKLARDIVIDDDDDVFPDVHMLLDVLEGVVNVALALSPADRVDHVAESVLQPSHSFVPLLCRGLMLGGSAKQVSRLALLLRRGDGVALGPGAIEKLREAVDVRTAMIVTDGVAPAVLPSRAEFARLVGDVTDRARDAPFLFDALRCALEREAADVLFGDAGNRQGEALLWQHAVALAGIDVPAFEVLADAYAAAPPNAMRVAVSRLATVDDLMRVAEACLRVPAATVAAVVTAELHRRWSALADDNAAAVGTRRFAVGHKLLCISGGAPGGPDREAFLAVGKAVLAVQPTLIAMVSLITIVGGNASEDGRVLATAFAQHVSRVARAASVPERRAAQALLDQYCTSTPQLKKLLA
jgi:hypothetical protein